MHILYKYNLEKNPQVLQFSLLEVGLVTVTVVNLLTRMLMFFEIQNIGCLQITHKSKTEQVNDKHVSVFFFFYALEQLGDVSVQICLKTSRKKNELERTSIIAITGFFRKQKNIVTKITKNVSVLLLLNQYPPVRRLILQLIHFFFFQNIFCKNIEAQICEILRIL